MQYQWLLLDLDGTISDPKIGFVRSLNYSLKHHGYDGCTEAEVTRFIGPPLEATFSVLTGVHDSMILQSLVSKYRERYSDIGFSENTLYTGIAETIRTLSESEIKLAVCTSKRTDFAERILELFNLRQYFEFVDGGDIGIQKWQQISALLQNKTLNNQTIMIGDRALDLMAANKNHLDSAAVLWGYGNEEELLPENPRYLFDQPKQWLSLIE